LKSTPVIEQADGERVPLPGERQHEDTEPMSKTATAAPAATAGQPDWVEPELATLTKDRFSDPAWLSERKFDGERCLAYRCGERLRLMTRSEQEVNATYPEIAVALAAQDCADFIVDGEVVAFDGTATSFSRLQQRLGVRHPDADLRAAVPVYFYLFDMLWADGRDVRPLPLLERKQVLGRLLSFGGPIRHAQHRRRDGEAYFTRACRLGWEGLVVKRADAPYRSGRSRDWLKFKCENSQEFVIGGYTEPQGTRTGLGALLLGYYDRDGKLAYAGKVGTGFDHAALASLAGALAGMERARPPFDRGTLPRLGVHWVEPRLVGQVAFSEWTSAGQLRHPRYQGLRRDKDPASVIRET
jgi:bifunctional non-homologous end joining protein LigD